jgi:hypothetical protein
VRRLSFWQELSRKRARLHLQRLVETAELTTDTTAARFTSAPGGAAAADASPYAGLLLSALNK